MSLKPYMAALLLLAGCQTAAPLRTVSILYTNDEHGWMEGTGPGLGAAELLTVWETAEGYRADGPFLLLSGGDNWTGPAISTWTAGASMVEVMNALGYDASAVGNHEFDFGLDVLRQRSAEADYPYLSANIRWRAGERAIDDLGVLPYSVRRVNGVRVGIIGLTTRDTPTSTHPRHVADLEFFDYETALRDTVPVVRAQGVDLLLVIAHVCVAELEPLIRAVTDLDLDLVGAGHCNEQVARQIGDTVLVGGGYHLTAYARADFTVDVRSGTVTHREFRTAAHPGAPANPAMARLIADWSASNAATLSELVGWSAQAEPRAEGRLGQAIVDAWLWADPTADIAITNAGGVRIDLPAGAIERGTLVAMLPFDNTIYALSLTGADLLRALDEGLRPLVAGLRRQGETWVMTETLAPVDPTRRYRVLVNSFMYAGGDGYGHLAVADPAGFDTGTHYGQPFQDWIRHFNSTESNPFTLN